MLRLGVGVLLLSCAYAGPARAGEEATHEVSHAATVRVGLVETLFRDTPAPLVQSMMRPFRSLMQSQTGLSGEIVPGIPPDDLGRQLKDDKVQLAVYHGFEFAWARQKDPNLKPLMIAVNQQSHLRALLLVREDGGAAAFADLREKSLAVACRTREHCHLFLERRCQAAGATPKTFFGRVVTPRCAEDALDAVVNGTVDATVVDGVFLDWYRQRKPARFARLKALEQSEVFPAAVVAYYGSAIDEATLRRFREGMISAKDNPRGQQLMSLCQITSFEPIPDDYDRLLTDIAKAYPPADKGQAKK
jgi:ABC-type phosphate/phosphonate transport system substrate-binding protein